MKFTGSISIDFETKGSNKLARQIVNELAKQILNGCINEACSKLESRLKKEIPKVEFYISADGA